MFRYADDCDTSSLSDQDCKHGPVLENLLIGLLSSFLSINAPKTNEMIIDFRRKSSSFGPHSCIYDQAVY